MVDERGADTLVCSAETRPGALSVEILKMATLDPVSASFHLDSFLTEEGAPRCVSALQTKVSAPRLEVRAPRALVELASWLGTPLLAIGGLALAFAGYET